MASTSKTTHVRQATWTAPAAASATYLTSAHSLDGSTLTSFTNQPDYPRMLQLVASGSTTANVTITGTDFYGNTISETVVLNGTTKVNTVNAYASVASVVLPTVAATTINIGIDVQLGLGQYCDKFSFSGFSGTSSFTYSTTVLSQNTVTLSSAPDGSTDKAVVYVPNTFYTYGRIWG